MQVCQTIWIWSRYFLLQIICKTNLTSTHQLSPCIIAGETAWGARRVLGSGRYFDCFCSKTFSSKANISVHHFTCQFEVATDTRLQFTTTGRLSQTFESLRFLDEYASFKHYHRLCFSIDYFLFRQVVSQFPDIRQVINVSFLISNNTDASFSAARPTGRESSWSDVRCHWICSFIWPRCNSSLEQACARHDVAVYFHHLWWVHSPVDPHTLAAISTSMLRPPWKNSSWSTLSLSSQKFAMALKVMTYFLLQKYFLHAAGALDKMMRKRLTPQRLQVRRP